MKNNVAICAVLSILVMPLVTLSMLQWEEEEEGNKPRFVQGATINVSTNPPREIPTRNLYYYKNQAKKRGEKKSYWKLLKQTAKSLVIWGACGAGFQSCTPHDTKETLLKTAALTGATGALVSGGSALYNRYRAATPGWKNQLNILEKHIDLSGPVVEVDGKTYLASKKFNNTTNINNPKMRKNQIYFMPTDEHLGDVFNAIHDPLNIEPNDIEAVIVRAAPGVPSTGWRFINKRIFPRIIVQVKEGKIWPVLKQLVGHFTPQHPHRSPYGEGIGSKPTHSASSDDIDLIFVDSEHITGPKD